MYSIMRWIRLGLGQVLPTAGKDHRGQLRVISGDGATTKDELYFGRDDAGTKEWVKISNADDASGGSTAESEAAVDLGSLAKYSGTFTLTDAALDSSDRVLVWADDNSDEMEMDVIEARAGVPGAGSVTVYWHAYPGPVRGTHDFRYMILGT